MLHRVLNLPRRLVDPGAPPARRAAVRRGADHVRRRAREPAGADAAQPRHRAREARRHRREDGPTPAGRTRGLVGQRSSYSGALGQPTAANASVSTAGVGFSWTPLVVGARVQVRARDAAGGPRARGLTERALDAEQRKLIRVGRATSSSSSGRTSSSSHRSRSSMRSSRTRRRRPPCVRPRDCSSRTSVFTSTWRSHGADPTVHPAVDVLRREHKSAGDVDFIVCRE